MLALTEQSKSRLEKADPRPEYSVLESEPVEQRSENSAIVSEPADPRSEKTAIESEPAKLRSKKSAPKPDQVDKWRLFVAVPIPDFMKQRLHQWCKEQQKELKFRKWVHPADYHITLQFLGDTPAAQVKSIMDSLQEAAGKASPFRLSASGIGTFGQPSRPRVLWSGVEGDISSLTHLHRLVTAANAKLGFVPEVRPYAPHITLARKYSEDEKLGHPLDNKEFYFGDWTNDTIMLYRTRVTESPMYEVVGGISLQS
ncbi:RNA 2',3'-cyclic phosphodiesterase [Paenibacillus fonticola]|uniref:RNA 2',3'-cyclic phosphodiesterase n=1 Tax=Paenibacillus fonticola TaxID=379896 RepID=UPI003B84AFE2